MTLSTLALFAGSLTTVMASAANTSLGPNTELVIGNALVSPDGFSRSAITVQGAFPAPPILATKASVPHHCCCHLVGILIME